MSSDHILIVIPCLNEVQHLPQLLDQLRAECSPGDLIVVADGGSTDGSQSVVLKRARSYSNIRLIHNAAKIQSAGVNAAVQQYGSGRKYLVRVDAHALYPENYARRLVAVAQAKSADSVVVPMKTVAETCFQKAVAIAQNSRIGHGGAAHRMSRQGGWVDHGHHALIRLDQFLAIGGYDENFSHNEDAEFDFRLTKNGARIWLDSSTPIQYLPRRSLISLFQQYLNYGRGRAKSLALHRNRIRIRQALPILVLPSVFAAVVGMSCTSFYAGSLLLAYPAFVWAGVSIVGGVFVSLNSGPSFCGLVSGLAAMAMHLGWSVGFWQERLSHL